MERKHFIAFAFLVLTGLMCHAQGFDDLKKSQPVVFNKKLQAVVNNNDANGLEKLLKSKPDYIEDGSALGQNDRGATLTIPLFYDVVDKTLSGSVSLDLCRVCLAAGCDVYTVYNGKTPIYRVMDFFATTPSDKCDIGMEVLKLLVAQKGFDLNRRYRSLPPPFSYLLSENFKFLGSKYYSKDYLSTELIRFLLDNGAYLNTYDENGASLFLLATQTDNMFLQDYLLLKGVKIKDTEGDNTVYAAIEDNDVPLLQRILKNYNVRLTTSMVKEWIPRVSPDMFEYLVNQCADNSKTYEELVDFRTHFSSRKEMVQDKYEDLAIKEAAAIYTSLGLSEFSKRYPDLTYIREARYREIATNDITNSISIGNIKKCEKEYPDFKAMTELKKKEIYLNDIKKLEESYSHAKSLVAENSFYYESRMSDIANSFVKNYQNYYDPDNQLPLANDLSRFYSALSKAAQGYSCYYHRLPKPGLFKDEMRNDQNRLSSAYSNLKYCSYGLSSEAMLSSIDKDLQKAKRCAEESTREYWDFCEKINIRVEKNTHPSGELSGVGLLGGKCARRDEGEIVIKMSLPTADYRIVVSYNEFWYYTGTIFSEGELRFDCFAITYVVSDLFFYSEMLDAEDSYLGFTERHVDGYSSLSELETDIVNRILKYYYSFR